MKRFAMVMVALMLVSVVALAADNMQKGSFQANINSENWTLNGGSGTRTHIVYVKFEKAYSELPQVFLSLTAYDGAAGKDGNVRVSIKAENITRDGFVIKVSTWGDSRVAGVDGSWLAFGK